MVINKNSLIRLSFWVAIVFYSCTTPGNVTDILKVNSRQTVVAHSYVKEDPIAQIINMPNNSDWEKSFEIDKDQDIQVYGVGELIYNLADVDPKYFFKGDDIELFFGLRKSCKFIFSWSDAKGKGDTKTITLGKRATLKGLLYKDSINSKYYTEIKFEWNALGIVAPKQGFPIQFELAVGDCDDRFKQKGKIAWHSKIADPLYEKSIAYGTLLLAGQRYASTDSDSLVSLNRIPDPDFKIQGMWRTLPQKNIGNLVAGEVKDKYDLSANVRSCWTKDSLYIFVEVQDEKLARIKRSEILTQQTFADYGWIENEKGQTVWKMSALYSKPAGGAIKNQLVDTIIHLKAGKYKLKYTTDESHSYNDWDDDPPKTPFYGIVIYKK